MIVLCIVSLVMLARAGQTLGKAALRIKIVLRDGSRAGLVRLVVLRSLVPGLVVGTITLGIVHASRSLELPPYLARIPLDTVVSTIVSLLLDDIRVLHPDRRAVHDLIAGTIVIRARRPPRRYRPAPSADRGSA